MTREEINKILENHKHWLNKDCDGWEDMCADFRFKDLRFADFYRANLRCANFEGALLNGTDFRFADLRGAIFCNTNLCSANFYGADLDGADLYQADLNCPSFSSAKNMPFIPFTCPDTGSFIAYKKASKYIIKLQIPEDAKRLSASGRKCRCDKAQVLEIQNIDGTIANINKIRSNHDETFIYEVGKNVSVDNFDNNRWNECSTGIHFFINRQEAVEYRM
mgnify:CR=1 FL=1